MRNQFFHKEAEACRRSAKLFAGKPEAVFLLHIASSFEELAVRDHQPYASAVNLEASSLGTRLV
jgi:hypothetical protein